MAPTPPDLVAPVTAALATGDTTAARQAFAALFLAPADQRPAGAGMDLLECRILLAEKQWQQAADLSGRVAPAPAATPEDRRAAWEFQAQCCTALGDDSAAADAVVRAQSLHQDVTAASLATSEQYRRNRFAVDGSRAYAAARLAESARAAGSAGRTDRAAAALFAHCLAFPDEPRFRENAVAAGEALLALGDAGMGRSTAAADAVALAAACFQRTLDSGLDRVFATTAMLAENQAQLDTVCRPIPEALLRRALAGLNRCEQITQSGRGVSDEQIADTATAYHKALALTYRPDGSEAAAALAALAERTKPPCSWLCLLELARLNLRDGDAAAALATLDRIEPRDRLLGLADCGPLDQLFAAERAFLQGVAGAARLSHPEAARHFGKAGDLGGPLLAPRARFEQARTLELAGAWRTAEEVLAGLCPSTPPGQLVSPDPSGRQDAAGVADDRGGTAESATPPRPALAVLAHQPAMLDPPALLSGSAGPPPGAAARRQYSAASAGATTARGVRGDAFPRPPEASSPAAIPPCLSRTAGIAQARLAEFGRRDGLPRRSPVQALPDDRTTRGDWFLGYGVERYLLCAQNYRLDRVGGRTADFAVRFATTDPKEPGRLWVSAKQTDDPAALWDPVRRLRLPANRDDRGEQCPLGKGPDLLLDCAIPAGEHVLSLYFVNDHHYYEPNRRYTVEIRGNDALLALADVRDFGGGVYQRLRVEGPRRLQVRIRRDASMNVLLQGVFLDPVYAPRVLPGALGARRSPGSHKASTSAASPVALWHRCEAFRGEARWREAEAAFAEFAKTVPEWALGPLLRELAAAGSAGEPGCQHTGGTLCR